jgi:hypothetical protein
MQLRFVADKVQVSAPRQTKPGARQTGACPEIITSNKKKLEKTVEIFTNYFFFKKLSNFSNEEKKG